MSISIETLTAIHTKVYKKHDYTFQTGLRAFMRGRRWARTADRTEKPPAGIAEKLLLWAEINSLIQKEVIRLEKEEKTNAEKSKIIEANAGRKVIKVSPGSSGD